MRFQPLAAIGDVEILGASQRRRQAERGARADDHDPVSLAGCRCHLSPFHLLRLDLLYGAASGPITVIQRRTNHNIVAVDATA
jgi:hypothetical protein